MERCSASQAARQAGSLWQWLCLAFTLSPQGGSLSLTPGFSLATREGGREEKAEGSLHTDSTRLPGSHLQQANHEEESLYPYSHFAFDLKLSPTSTRDNGGAIHFQTPPGSGLWSWGLSSDHR